MAVGAIPQHALQHQLRMNHLMQESVLQVARGAQLRAYNAGLFINGEC